MDKLEATFRIVTPMFLGGANPNDFAELRPPSIKSAMRYWYRALDKDFKAKEPHIFGGTQKGEGQSKFLLSMNKPLKESHTFPKGKIQYFSFPFNMGDKNKRRYIKEGQSFKLQLTFRKKPDDQQTRRAIVSSLWLLGHLGGLGSRSRRGFGTVALEELKNNDWTEVKELTSAHQASAAEEWIENFKNGLKTLHKWFPSQPGANHLVLGAQSVFHLVAKQGRSFNSWDGALADAAGIMQKFRDECKPDYLNVKGHAPKRTAFGLPLTFKSTPKNAGRTFLASEQNATRSGSRIFVRIIQIGKSYYPLFCRFGGSLLSPGNKITDSCDKENNYYLLPSDQILDDFMNGLPAGGRISW